MNRKKIKVNNEQELITEAEKWKIFLGGEWKLREKYVEMPTGLEEDGCSFCWGIIISDGKKEVEIFSIGKGKKGGIFDEIDVREQLNQLFPEGEFAYFASAEKDGPWGDGIGRPIQEKMDVNTFKKVKKMEGKCKCNLYRYLVAEKHCHLGKIFSDYIEENKSKIYQSTNPLFSSWVEIIDGQDGNMYLYLGEKNEWGGREIKVGIKKNQFEFSPRETTFDSPYQSLENYWTLFTLDRPRNPAENHEYFSETGGLEEEWKRNWLHRGKLCRKYLEELKERMSQRMNYWKKKAEQSNHQNDEENTEFLLVNAHISEINHELEDMKNNRPNYYAACDKDCDFCGVKLCCHFEGRPCTKNKNWLFVDKEKSDFYMPFFHEPQKFNTPSNPSKIKFWIIFFVILTLFTIFGILFIRLIARKRKK